MDPQTLELLRLLQSSAHDAESYAQIRSLLSAQRRKLAAADDRATLADISELLEVWAANAPPNMAATALNEAALIAEEDLEQAERAVQLYTQSFERDPSEETTLTKLEAMLARRNDRERFETMLAKQAEALVAKGVSDPSLPAALYKRLGGLRADRGDIAAAIEAYEQVLDLDANPDILRTLAEAYTLRGGVADAQQAADLYFTLGDVAGAEEGAQWLERALDQVPAHDDALALLESFVPEEQHKEKLRRRWEAYVAHSENEAAAGKRRLALARMYAEGGDPREALICLGPLVERSDADAIKLQAEYLATLRAEEARTRESATNGTHLANANGKAAQKPPTLVGFRVPPPDPEPNAAAPIEEPITETHAKPVPPAIKRAARSGETLVGFRVPAEFAEDAKAAEQESNAAESNKPISVVALRPDAASQDIARARAAGDTRTGRSTPVATPKAPARSTMKGGFAGPAAATTPTPAASAASTASIAKPAGPAAAAAALKAAARASQAPPPAGPGATTGPEAKIAALRAGLRDTVPGSIAAPRSPLPIAPRRSLPAPATPRPLVAAPVRASAPQLATNGVHSAEGSEPADGEAMPVPDQVVAGVAAADLPITAQTTAFGAQSLFDAQAKSSKRWWIASGVALLALGGGLAMIFKPSPQPTAPVPTRGESQAPMPAPAAATATAAATPTPVPTPVPSAAPVAAAPEAAATGAATPAPSDKPVEPAAAVATPAPATAAPAPKKSAPEPEVKTIAKKVRVTGSGVSAKDVTEALDENLGKIERCYARTLERDARASGQITFSFTIDKAGHATRVRKVKSTMKDTKLPECAGDAIEKIRFPKAKKKPVKVTAPLDFHKA